MSFSVTFRSSTEQLPLSTEKYLLKMLTQIVLYQHKRWRIYTTVRFIKWKMCSKHANHIVVTEWMHIERQYTS